MLRLLIDTSVWLDLAKRRDAQKWIVPLSVLKHQGKLELAVPLVVVEEFERNRPRAEAAVTSSVLGRFQQLRKDLHEFGGDARMEWLEEMAHQVPMVQRNPSSHGKLESCALWRPGHAQSQACHRDAVSAEKQVFVGLIVIRRGARAGQNPEGLSSDLEVVGRVNLLAPPKIPTQHGHKFIFEATDLDGLARREISMHK